MNKYRKMPTVAEWGVCLLTICFKCEHVFDICTDCSKKTLKGITPLEVGHVFDVICPNCSAKFECVTNMEDC